ncbi:primosomal replication protein PriC [Thalassotalea maritima]|uniref:primosomal replication protein PriC n=1 Tax=Thalassotalea maritima TaxID=3242416 RepID=UPI0035288B63
MQQARLIHRFKSLIEQLQVDAKQADQQNKQRRVHRYVERQSLFAPSLFPITSNQYGDYVHYLQQQLSQLEKLLNSDKNALADSLLERLEAQVSAMIIALKSESNRLRDSDYRLQTAKRLNQKHQRQKKQPINVTSFMTAHQMHSKLVEYRGFEQRLELMLKQQEQLLAQDHGENKQHITQAIFTIHQRLGRCRRAINELEKQIEDKEKSRF